MRFLLRREGPHTDLIQIAKNRTRGMMQNALQSRLYRREVLATALVKHYNGGNGGIVRTGGRERLSRDVIDLYFIQDAAC